MLSVCDVVCGVHSRGYPSNQGLSLGMNWVGGREREMKFCEKEEVKEDHVVWEEFAIL